MRDKALALVAETIEHAYPVLWTISRGDFSGREVTIDVFNIAVEERRPFLRKIRGIRERLREMVGSPCLFVFHTPEATREHYQHLIP